jgi:hypothetical protein
MLEINFHPFATRLLVNHFPPIGTESVDVMLIAEREVMVGSRTPLSDYIVGAPPRGRCAD